MASDYEKRQEKQSARADAKIWGIIGHRMDSLPLWKLGKFFAVVPVLTFEELIIGLTNLREPLVALRQEAPGQYVLAMGLLARKVGLSRRDIEAGLNLHPPEHDLSSVLLDTLRALADEVRNGTLPLHRIAAAVNADRSEHEALSHRLIASRLRALGFPFTHHHPTSVVVIPRLMPPQVDTAPSARENGSNIQ